MGMLVPVTSADLSCMSSLSCSMGCTESGVACLGYRVVPVPVVAWVGLHVGSRWGTPTGGWALV